MAMIKCPDCGRDISDQAPSCLGCGRPMMVQQQQQMRPQMQPQMQPTMQPQQERQQAIQRIPEKKKLSKLSLWAFILSIIGCMIPIGGILGIVDLVKNKNDDKKHWGSYVAIVLFCFFMIYVIFGHKSATDTQESAIESSSQKTESTVQNNSDKEKEEIKQDVNLSDGLEQFNTGEYLYITTADLDKYSPNMAGVKVYTVIDIDDMKNNKIQSTLNEGFMMSNFDVGSRYGKYEDAFKDGDIVAVLGVVEDYTDYMIAGKSTSLKDCYVFASGQEAEKYQQSSSDESLSQYFEVTEEVADTSSDISEEEYKALCEKLDYESILRNPDSYKKKYCVISGKVDQVIEGWFGSFTFYIVDGNGNKWGCTYSYKEGESHLLENDNVTVYGQCYGTQNTETLLGKQVTLPYVDLEYIY